LGWRGKFQTMMKNFHKVRGKREFLFDDRELIVLGGGAAMICVLIFALGFLFGQGLQEKSVASPLEIRDSGLNRDVPATEESFAQNTVPLADNQTQPSSGTTDSKKKAQMSYYQVLPDSGTYVEVEATPKTKAVAPAPIADPAQPEKGVSATPKPASAEEKPAQPVVTAPVAMRQEEPVSAPALPNVPRTPNDVIYRGRQPQRTTADLTVPGGVIYSVQVSSSTNRSDSERLQQKYLDLGYEAYVMTADLAEKGLWYRVRVGNLPTREAAEQFKRELLSKVGHLAKNPFVIKVTE